MPRVQQDEVPKQKVSESRRDVPGRKVNVDCIPQLDSDVQFDAAKLSGFATDCDLAIPDHRAGGTCFLSLWLDHR